MFSNCYAFEEAIFEEKSLEEEFFLLREKEITPRRNNSGHSKGFAGKRVFFKDIKRLLSFFFPMESLLVHLWSFSLSE